MKGKKRLIVLLLTFAMVLSQMSVVTFAVDNVAADNSDKAVTEQSADVTQPAAEPEEVAFDQSKTVSGVKVSVKADKGVFPAGSELSVEEVKVPKAVDTKDAAEAYAFDISILADGKKIQPDGNAEVSFTTDEVKKYDTEVFHMDGKKAEELDVDKSGETATVDTDGFSIYAVVFYRNNESGPHTETAYMEPGDSTTLLDVFTELNLATPEKRNIKSVTTSGDDLLDLTTIPAGGKVAPKDFVLTVKSDGSTGAETLSMQIESGNKPGTFAAFTLYVKIDESDKYEVKFDLNGGTISDEEAVKPQYIDSDGVVTKPAVDPEKEGFIFAEWHEQLEGGGVDPNPYNFETPVTSDMTLVAVYKEHEHVWNVDVEGNKATISCVDAGRSCSFYKNPVTVELTANSVTYDGSGHGATISGLEAFQGVVPEVSRNKPRYEGINGTDYDESTAQPKDAGDYKASVVIKVNRKDGDSTVTDRYTLTQNYTINVQEIEVTLPTVSSDGLVYNAGEQGLLASGGTVGKEGLTMRYAIERGELIDYKYDNWEDVKAKNADTYTICYQIFDEDGEPFDPGTNYKLVDSEGEVVEMPGSLEKTIDKANPLKEGPDGLILPYTGENQVLVKEGELEEFAEEDQPAPEILYSKAKRDGYGKNLPSEKDTGNYTFYWKIDRNGNDNYVDWYDEGRELPAKIYDGYVTPPVPSDGLVYNGEEQSLLAEGAVISDDIYEMYPGAEIYVVYGISESDKEEPSPYTNKTYSKVMGTDAGPYYVWYKAIVKQDGKTVYRSEPDYVVANIDKAVAEVTKEPVGRNVVYSGGGYRLVETAAVVDGGTAMYSGDPEMDLDDYSNSIFNKDEKYGLYGRDADDYTVYYYVKGDENHYDSDLYQVTAKISPVEAELEWGEKSFEYDKEEHVPTATVKNLKTNTGTGEKDECTVTVEGAQVNVGKDYTATATELSNPNYTLPEDATTTFEITAKEVEILFLRAENKVYDGSTAANLVYDSVIFEGRELGDELEIAGYAYFDDKNVGTNKPVTALLFLVGPSANNYKLEGSVSPDWGKHIKIDYDLRASITPLEATIKWYKNADAIKEAPAGAIDYVYNGKEQAPAAKIANAIESDGVEVVVGGEQKNAGKKYTAEVIELSGEDKDNYKLGSTAKKKFNILPKEVVLADWEDAESLVYDGKDKSPSVVVAGPAPEGEGTDSDGLIIKGDDPDIVIFEVRNSENKVVTPIDADDYIANATGLIDDNYVLREDDPSLQHIFTVDEREAELVWSNTSPVYNGNEQQPVATVGNLVTREDTGKVDECDVTVEGAKVNAGNYEAEATALSNKNYKLPDDPTTKFSILPRQIQVVWSNLGFVYDGKAHKPTATITNIAKKDDVSAVVTDEQTNAGTYTATVSSLTGTAAANYTIPLPKPTAQFEIGQATVMVTADDQTIFYGENFDKSKVSYTGWQGSDTEAVLTAVPTVSSTYFVNAKYGTYKLNPSGAAAKNYTFKYDDGVLTVNNKVATLVAKAAPSGSKATLSWNKVTGAKKYEVYFNKCNSNGKEYSCKKIATVKTNKFKKKGLKKGTCYKFYVVAKDANGKTIAKSKTGHFVAGGYNDSYTNAKSLKVNPSSVSLTSGQSKKLKVSQNKAKSGRILLDGGHAALLRFKSSNKKVATVNSNGVVKAVGKGYCEVYVQATNGMWKKVAVTVK